MFDIITKANELFNFKPSSCEEILEEFVSNYELSRHNLPDRNHLEEFISNVPAQDKITVSMRSSGVTIYTSSKGWETQYEQFTNELYDDEIVEAVIRIKKVVSDGALNIYHLESFKKYLMALKYEQLFQVFTDLFSKSVNTIFFRLLKSHGILRTGSIIIADEKSLLDAEKINVQVAWNKKISRSEKLKNCHDASVFLDKAKFPLIPQDFSVIELTKNTEFKEFFILFDRLRSILSYIYLANSSYIADGKAVLQFAPSVPPEEYRLDELANNSNVSQIYDWAFNGENCIDKASIARNIINIYCRTRESILEIDEKLFNSIKSNYVIYQNNHADQYIEMKNKISEFIVESVKQLQDISHGMAESLGNNFIAILVFLMTVLLTDSFDFSQFMSNDVSPNVTAVCGVFTGSSLLYLIVTIITGNLKWKWLKKSYDDLKENYKGVLDEKDIEEAFNNGKPITDAEKEYKDFKWKILIIWSIAILMLGVFTFALAKNKSDNHETGSVSTAGSTIQGYTTTSEETVTSKDETAASSSTGSENAMTGITINSIQ